MMTTNMQRDISRQEISNNPERRRVAVLPLGFEATEVERLKRIFQLEAQGERLYIIPPSSHRGPIDIVLLNHDNPSIAGEKNAVLKSHPQARLVTASRGPLAQPPQYHIRGMLIAARVLSVLDKIPTGIPTTMPDGGRPCAELHQDRFKVITPVLTPVPLKHPGAYRALVVDDSATVQKSLEIKLAEMVDIAAVDVAENGEQALEKAAAAKYDLIFLDVMMPGIDGYETCSRLRKLAEYKKTPIIMVSGKTSPLDEVKGILAGCTTYLTKPVQDEAFRQLSQRVLGWLAAYQKSETLPH